MFFRWKEGEFMLFFLGTYATVYKGKSYLLNGYIALKEIRLEQEEGRSLFVFSAISRVADRLPLSFIG